jgi:hypothetical protein
MENAINKLKIIMKRIYAIECRIAEKHAISESRLVKLRLNKMKRECEML